MVFSISLCKYCTDTCRSTGEYIIFYQGGKIDHGTHVRGPFSQPSTESEYNVACTAGTSLSHLSMLINELLNKDTYIILESAPLIILDSKSAVCIDNNGKDTKQTRNIYRRVNFVINDEKFKMHKIIWCKEGLKLADIATDHDGENDLNTRINYFMVGLYNWDITLVKEGWQ